MGQSTHGNAKVGWFALTHPTQHSSAAWHVTWCSKAQCAAGWL